MKLRQARCKPCLRVASRRETDLGSGTNPAAELVSKRCRYLRLLGRSLGSGPPMERVEQASRAKISAAARRQPSSATPVRKTPPPSNGRSTGRSDDPQHRTATIHVQTHDFAGISMIGGGGEAFAPGDRVRAGGAKKWRSMPPPGSGADQCCVSSGDLRAFRLANISRQGFGWKVF